MSEVKVNKISPRSGTGVQLGDSGDTITIPAGATINNQGTATNFGATGSASWNTTVKTGDFTAVAGEGYFVNTTSGAINVTLPAGSAGDVVAIKDYAGTFDTNKVTLIRNGSDKIGGSTDTSTLSKEGIAVTLIFIDSTQGWLVTDDGEQSSVTQAEFIVATGGTITTACTNFKVHTFTGPGTFTVCSVGNPAGSTTVDYLVVAGGGGTPGLGHSNTPNGGGGAGGLRASGTTYSIGCNPAKPIVCGVSAITVTATGFPISVGGGGAGGSQGPGNSGANGANSSFSTITSAGGGVGAHPAANPAGNGGSGGGGTKPLAAGSGNTPPVSPSQGNPGGVGVGNPTNPAPGDDNTGLGGGGGAVQPGLNGGNVGNPRGGGGAGGAGAGFTNGVFGASNGECSSSIQYFAGGGGGGVYTPSPGPNVGGDAGLGGGGHGGSPACHPNCGGRQGQAGTSNTGGGGGANGGATSPSTPFSGNAGGSGIVVIRYKFQ